MKARETNNWSVPKIKLLSLILYVKCILKLLILPRSCCLIYGFNCGKVLPCISLCTNSLKPPSYISDFHMCSL